MCWDDRFLAYRNSIFNPEARAFLLTRIAESEQEEDLSIPPNCKGYGRIRHFRRVLDEGWYDPLPMDPMSQSLGIPYTELVKAQVFQIASCNLHCWYCFVPNSLKSGDSQKASYFSANQMVELFVNDNKDIRIIDLSGGNPELAPEWILDTMKALEAYKLQDQIYLWSDDTLTTDYFFRFLSKDEMRYVYSIYKL